VLANSLCVLVGVLHLYFLYLEMFQWTKPLGLKIFKLTPAQAEVSRALAMNQGLYNGFLAAGLFWGVFLDNFPFKVFFLCCVMAAGMFGAATVNKRILWVQAVPAACALFLVLITR
jgi:putative membrane protein